MRENLDLQSKCKRRIDETLDLSEQIEYVYVFISYDIQWNQN